MPKRVNLKDRVPYFVWFICRAAVAVFGDNTFRGRVCHAFQNNKLVYYPIAKVANTSILSALAASEKDGKAKIYHDRRSFPHLRPSEEIEDQYIFAIVRNPFDRLVSCYINKYQINWSEAEKQSIPPYFNDYLFGYLKNVKSFEEFIKKIVYIPHRLMDMHFCLQYLHLYKRGGRCLVDHVGHFEELNEEWDALRERFDLMDLPHYKKSTRDKWQDYYTEELADLVYKKFRKDFETFGYTDTYNELLDHIRSKKNNTVD